MSAPWWGKEASPAQRNQAPATGAAPGAWPSLVDATRDAVFREASGRVASFTPEWSSRRPDDAGIALARLFSEEMEPVLQRLNQLPENAFIRFLQGSGVQGRPATPATALLQFSVAAGATQSVYVAAGFQVGAAAAGGGDMVIFETDGDLNAIPGTIAEIYVHEFGFYRTVDATQGGAPFQPFGAQPQPGIALLVGIAAAPSLDPGAQLSLGIQVQGSAGTPPPVASGGAAPLPRPLAPLLQWQVLDGSTFRDAPPAIDETSGLTQSGIVTLRLPDSWRPGIPPGAPDTAPLLWLRAQILYGGYPEPPVLQSVKLNIVRATAARSFFNEVLTPVPTRTGGAVMQLAQTPVIPGSLSLEVDDTAGISFTGAGPAPPFASRAIWTEVSDLAEYGPDDKVYMLELASGLLTFGDGVHGMALPAGFRNVVAAKYRVGSGAGGAVAAGKITNLVNSVPFLTGVTNPWPASGGADAETQDHALQRGPEQLRARGRAVAMADYEILALGVPGAQVSRANAVRGFHPAFPGTPIPGVVCVFIVPPEQGAGPPTPDAETLRAVSTALSGGLAPAGIEVVAAAPRYHMVRIETRIVIDPSYDRGAVVAAVLALLDGYLDPISGGDDGRGWPFGGALSNAGFVRKLLTGVAGLTAVPALTFVVDGVRGAPCGDVAISPNTLVWPLNHDVLALGPGDVS